MSDAGDAVPHHDPARPGRRLHPTMRPRIWSSMRARATVELDPQAALENTLSWARRVPFWVVYGPFNGDRPGHHLARLFFGDGHPEPTNYVVVALHLAGVQQRLPHWLERAAPLPGDDPCIMELRL